MTANELASRQKKAIYLSVTVVDDGYSVPSSDGREYIVSYDDGRLVCKCIDFTIHKADAEWKCKHVLAVMLFLQKSGINNQPSMKPINRKSRYDAIDLN
jgi:hypothetical protein